MRGCIAMPLALVVLAALACVVAGNEAKDLTPVELDEASIHDQLRQMRGKLHRASWGEVVSFEQGASASSSDGEERLGETPQKSPAQLRIEAQLKQMRKPTHKASWAKVEAFEKTAGVAPSAPKATKLHPGVGDKQMDADLHAFHDLKKDAAKRKTTAKPNTLSMMDMELGDSNSEKPAPKKTKTAAVQKPAPEPAHAKVTKPGFKKIPGTPAKKMAAAPAAKKAPSELGDAKASVKPVAHPHPKPPPSQKKQHAKQAVASVKKPASAPEKKQVAASVKKQVAAPVKKQVAAPVKKMAHSKKAAGHWNVDEKGTKTWVAGAAVQKKVQKATPTAATAVQKKVQKATPTAPKTVSVHMPGLKQAFETVKRQHVIDMRQEKKNAPQKASVSVSGSKKATQKLNAEMMKKPYAALQAASKVYVKAAKAQVPVVPPKKGPTKDEAAVIAAKKQLAADTKVAHASEKAAAVAKAKVKTIVDPRKVNAGCKDCKKAQVAAKPTGKPAAPQH